MTTLFFRADAGSTPKLNSELVRRVDRGEAIFKTPFPVVSHKYDDAVKYLRGHVLVNGVPLWLQDDHATFVDADGFVTMPDDVACVF